jgi:hypothetical protein
MAFGGARSLSELLERGIVFPTIGGRADWRDEGRRPSSELGDTVCESEDSDQFDTLWARATSAAKTWVWVWGWAGGAGVWVGSATIV